MVNVSLPFYKWYDGTRPEEILGKRLKTETGRDAGVFDLVKLVEDVRKNELVIVDEKFATKGLDALRFKKYGYNVAGSQELRISKHMTMEEMISDRIDPAGLIIPALRENQNVRNSYGWLGAADGYLRTVPLYSCVEGAEIAALAWTDIKPRRYGGEEGDELQSNTLPSRHVRKKKHTVTIRRFPFENLGDKAYAEWSNIRMYTTVEGQQHHGFSRTDRKGPVYKCEPHGIALWHASVQRMKGDRALVNPFLQPTEKTLQIIENARHRCAQRYTNKHGETDYRNLNVAEKEKLLWYATVMHRDRISDLWRLDPRARTVINGFDYLVTGKDKKYEGK
jgi:hypothetical protein